MPEFLLKENASGFIDNIDMTAYATRLQLDYLLNYTELYRLQDFQPSDYTPWRR